MISQRHVQNRKNKRSKMRMRMYLMAWTEMAELDRVEVLIELQGSRRQVSLKKESPEQLQAEFRHFDSSIELAVCSDRDSPGRKFLLQRWSEKWRCFVDVAEIAEIKDGDRLTIAPVPAKEIIPTKVSFEIVHYK